MLELVTAKRPPANSPATGPKSAQQQQQAAPSLDHLLRLSSTVHQQQQLLLVGHGGGGEHGRLVVVVADAVAQLIRDAVKCSSTEKQNKAEVGKRSQLALPHYEAVPIRLRLKVSPCSTLFVVVCETIFFIEQKIFKMWQDKNKTKNPIIFFTFSCFWSSALLLLATTGPTTTTVTSWSVCSNLWSMRSRAHFFSFPIKLSGEKKLKKVNQTHSIIFVDFFLLNK